MNYEEKKSMLYTMYLYINTYSTMRMMAVILCLVFVNFSIFVVHQIGAQKKNIEKKPAFKNDHNSMKRNSTLSSTTTTTTTTIITTLFRTFNSCG